AEVLLGAAGGVPPEGRDDVKRFIRALDDHLVRTVEERVHLWSFYANADIGAAVEHDWVEPSAFFSAWAAGPTRSKYEVLDRGRQAAALATQLRDGLRDALGNPASPYSP